MVFRFHSAVVPTVFLALSGSAMAAQFNVNTAADTPDIAPGDGLCADSSGQCSLRAAIQEANALGGSHVIRLQAGATYLLSRAGANEDGAATGDLDVMADIQIIGNGATVDALGLDRAFDVLGSGVLRAQGFTVTNGAVTHESGGGFRSVGRLELGRMRVSRCSATGAGASGGAIFNDNGDARLLNTQIWASMAERAGGAIEADGGVTRLENARIFSNSAGPGPGNGGGFHLTGMGDVQVIGGAFRGNTASREGGGLWNSAVGTMSIADCKITDNVALGTAADDGGGGVFNDGGSLTVARSVVSSNSATMGSGSGGGLFNNGGILEITLSKIQSNASSRAGGGIEVIGGTTSLFNNELSANTTGASPGNGGGLHLTGNGSVTVALTDVLNNVASAEGGGLWNSGSGTMTVRASLVAGNVASGAAADQGGGGLFNDGGTMIVENSVLADNVANGMSGSGGGALNFGGLLTVTGTRFEGNQAQRAGGAVEASGGTTELTDVVARSNACGPAPGNGGGLHLTGTGSISVDDSVFDSNVASAEGGGLWNSALGVMTITNTDIHMNTASGDDADQGGGGVFNDGGQLTITGGVLSENVADGASGSGGGIFNNAGALVVEMATILSNDSQRAGGGIEANAGTTDLTRVRLEGNSTGPMPGNGGGLHLTGAGTVSVTESSVARNSAASEGGGLWNSSTGTMTVTTSRICENAAPAGSEVFNDGGTFTLDGKPVAPGS